MVSSGMCLVTHCYVRDMSQLAAKDEITGALLRYTRGIDRLDGDLVLSAFHPGAMCADYGAEPMRIEDFVTYAIPKLGDAYSATQHRVSNVAIEFDEGNRSAICEAYVLAFHVKQTDAAPKLHTFNGRGHVSRHSTKPWVAPGSRVAETAVMLCTNARDSRRLLRR
jgi:hypothetical protein